MDNQEASTSASFSSKQKTMDKIEDGQTEKKLKKNLQSENENQVEVEGKCFMEQLPPEILIEILKNVDTKSLVSSRLVNRRWNGISTEIIKSRPDLEITFDASDKNETAVIKQFCRERSLSDLVNCFHKSKNFPFTRFDFIEIDCSAFIHDDWIEFIYYLRKNIKCLKLNCFLSSNDDLMKLAKKLKILLLCQLPKLEEFGLDFTETGKFDGDLYLKSQIQLFPTNEAPLQLLPHLKILHLERWNFSWFEGILNDLVRASPSLQLIDHEIDRSEYNWAPCEMLHILHTVRKLYCLEHTYLYLSADFLSDLKEKGVLAPNFKLKMLYLEVSSEEDIWLDEKRHAFWLDASEFLSSLFESSKNTLGELTMDSLGFLPQLKLSKFNKLTSLCITEGEEKNIKFLPSGLDPMEIFPVLQKLELQVSWADFFPDAETSHVSSFQYLKTLKIKNGKITENDIARISQVCPNLKDFVIGYWVYQNSALENFPEVGAAIWTNLKQLESLSLFIAMDTPENTLSAVDLCFTGFSEEDVIRLYDLSTANNLLKKCGARTQVSQTELKLERKNPSILDLKDLRNLEVYLTWKKKENLQMDLSKNMIAVSEKYAFELMENLNFQIKHP